MSPTFVARQLRLPVSLLACAVGSVTVSGQVQNISAWTLDSFDSGDITVGGITYQNTYATPLTITTAVGTYDAGTAGAGADDVFIRRNTATPTATTNVVGQAVSVLSGSSGSSTVFGTQNDTLKDLLLGGNVLNSTWDTFANTTSGAGGVGHNIERIDFVWSNGYTIVGDEVIIVFNFDPIGAQDDFRVAVFTEIDGSADKLPTAYANTGVLVTGTSFPDKLPLPLPGSPLSSPSSGFRTTGVDDLTGTALNLGDSQTVGIGGVAISLATLGISPGQTIFGYSLIPADANASSAANLLDFTNSSLYPTTTPNADQSGTTDFSTFGGRIATIDAAGAGGAFEWDNGAGSTAWGGTYGGANNNWFSTVPADNNLTPRRDADVYFRNLATGNQLVDLSSSVEVRKIFLDATVNYTIGTSGDTPTITMGDPNLAGAPSIEIDRTYRDGLQHKINANILLQENLSINNNTAATSLCINGYIETRSTLFPAGNSITVTGTGPVNFNGDISGSGDLFKQGSGIATINNNNSNDPAGSLTQWIGNVHIQEGQLVITADGALGGSVGRATNANRVTGNNTLQFANATAADLKVGQLVTGTGIPADTYITNIAVGGTNTTVTLSNALTANNNSGTTNTFAGVTTVSDFASLTLRATQTGTAGNYTNTPLNYTVAETISLQGYGPSRLPNANVGALFNDGGDNTLGANVTLRLTGTAAIGSRDDNLTINGVIREATSGLSLVKVGDGVVTLTNAANSYTGATVIAGGALRIATNETALPGGFATGGASGGNLTLEGGVLEIGLATNFTRTLGAGADQVQFTGDGGFSAFGGTRTVTLGGTTTWGSGSFVPDGKALLLSSEYATGQLNFTNAINLGGAVREIRVANGSAAVDGQLSGILSNGGIDKTGAGTLELTANNTYTGDTRVSAGALRVGNANVIDGSNLVLNGGVLEINGDLDGVNAGDFTRTVSSTGSGNVRWSGDGGFSASGANREVRLNNGTAAVTWGGTSPTDGFVSATNALILGSVSSANTVTLANPLFLDGSGTRTIRTVAGTASLTTTPTAILSGDLSGAADLAVTGNGRLDLTANNSHTGAVVITGAEVRLSSNVGDLAQSSSFTVRQGGTLSLDNTTNTVNTSDRLGNSAAISLQGGTLNLFGRTGNQNTAETIGAVTLASGANTINSGYGDSNGSAVLTLSGLSRTTGATVNFTNLTSGGAAAGTLGNTGDNSRIVVTGLANTNGIVGGWATVGDNWATEITDARGIGALGTYETSTTPGNWAATENINISGSATNDATRTVNSFRLDAARTLDLDNNATSRAFTIASGGILSVGNVTNIIRADNAGSTLLAAGSGDLVVHTQNTGTNVNTLQINAQIADNAGGNGLTKSGGGTLQLGGTMANTYTGVTTINDGVLVLNKTGTGANSIAVAGDANLTTDDIIIGDGRGTDILRLGANEQIADNAQVLLRGGELGNALNVARLELNGSTDITSAGVSRIETFHTLSVTGNSVLDFGGGNVCSPTFLFLDVLSIAADTVLNVTNWIDFTDFLLVKKVDFDESQLARIIFDGYPGTARFTNYDNTYWQITPVPEPSTYGFLAMAGLGGLYATRRRKRPA